MLPPDALRDYLGDIDVYLLDQILKGRFFPGAKILDAGCGFGRNIVYFLREQFDVCGVDQSPTAVLQVRKLAAALAPQLPEENFRIEPIESSSYDDSEFDVVLAIAILHFARDEDHFHAMLQQLWRVLKPGGILFARLASNIGIEERVQPLGDGRYHLPDGSDRYLVDEPTLQSLTRDLRGQLIEPIKTVNVQNARCMTTWVLQKLLTR